MKSKVIKIMLSCIVCGTMFGGSISHAAETDTPYEEEDIEEVFWYGNAYVPMNNYVNVTSSNNVFNDSPTVTNSAGNPGILFFRIVNQAGAVIGNAYAVEPGHSIQMDQIPWNIGTYTLQAMAVEVAGTYFITID